ncbi:MAG: CBS domain-containing protein [Chromatocurvus sp.]
MQSSAISGLLVLGVVLAFGSLLLRVFSNGKYELKTIDLVFLIIPLVVVALATGKLQGLDLFGVKADLSALWAEAAETRIEQQVAPSASASVQDVVRVMEMATKGGVNEVQRLIERRVEALEFRLGHGGYYGPAIRTYLEALSGSSHLRSVVVDHQDGTLFGMFHAADLIAYLRVSGDPAYNRFQDLLNNGSDTAKRELERMPGFVAAEHAVQVATSKRDALAQMAQMNLDSLPVIDDTRQFVGTVERSKLTASLILAISERIEQR